MSFTPQQLAAIQASGNTLVVAGAGAGKTGTLVERCIRLLVRDGSPVEVERVLIVTFTEAAAAEVRNRIRERLDKTLEQNPANEWIQRQVAALDSAHISTLHSFCLSLIREHFYELDLDPAVSVMPAEQAEMLFLLTFEELLGEHYSGRHEFSGGLQELIRSHFDGWDKRLLTLVRRLHHFTQTRPNPDQWLRTQLERLSCANCPEWHAWYAEAVRGWCESWHPFLASLPAENENAHHCSELLKNACGTGDMNVIRAVLDRQATECWPKRKKTEHKKPFEALFEEADFLQSLATPAALEEDWNWSRAPLEVLLRFVSQFTERFTTAKRDRGMVDFHDLEQCALRLLWDSRQNGPTELARAWQRRLVAIFVDEYQDINAAQDLIISAVSRPENQSGTAESAGNRFLVGDIKQSIYRFRQADPSIFRGYLQNNSGWATALLSDNFRSHEGILNFINPLFAWLMREQMGGVTYDQNAFLRYGGAPSRPEMAAAPGQPWPVELNLFFTGNATEEENENREPDDLDLENAEKEARLVAERLRQLRDSGHVIYHRKEKVSRPVEWRDMVVLLRAASGKLEIYARAFEAIGVPLQTKRDGFFTTPEVLDLVNVLTILDNPLQDIPLVAVLRSPLVGLTANDLAAVRVHAPRNRFWDALNQFLELKKDSPARQKIERFLERYHCWRNPRSIVSLAQRLEAILSDTGYADWLLGQPRGQQRHANIQQFLRVARQFDETRGESLYLFLRHIQDLQDAAGDIEPASFAEENAVRLMTVHQSKGLEFPVVAVADLGKRFNTTDQSSSILLHERYGFCATVQPANTTLRYPSLPLWLASRHERIETVGEEMRVLYVALTRAENLLLLFGTATEKQPEKWANFAQPSLFPQQVLKLSSWLDWFGSYATWQYPDWQAEDSSAPFTVRRHQQVPAGTNHQAATSLFWSDDQLQALQQRVTFAYPHEAAVAQSAKASVSTLRQRATEEDQERAPVAKRFIPADLTRSSDARERGVATHTFLQHHDPAGALDASGLRGQARFLCGKGLLSAHDLIDYEGIASFWSDSVGRECLARHSNLHRELPFTVKLSRSDLASLGLENALSIPDHEFVLVQGVADFVILSEKEIWLLDFKTDQISVDELDARVTLYEPQIALYRMALERIYQRRVPRAGLFFIALQRFHWF